MSDIFKNVAVINRQLIQNANNVKVKKLIDYFRKSINVNFLTTIKGNNSALYSSKEVRQKILNNVDSFLEEPFTN